MSDLAEEAQAATLVARPFQLPGLATVKIEEAQYEFTARIADAGNELAPRPVLYRDVEHLSLDLNRNTAERARESG